MTLLTQAFLAGLVLVCLFLASLPARADTRDPDVKRRQWHQERRIGQGAVSGQLTPGELVYLKRQQASIRTAEALMKADGRLTPGERVRLHRLLNQSSRDIFRLKHNQRRMG
jgi:hypothetical protein